MSEPLAHPLFQSLWLLLVSLRLVVRAPSPRSRARSCYLAPPPLAAVAASGSRSSSCPGSAAGGRPRAVVARSPSAAPRPLTLWAAWPDGPRPCRRPRRGTGRGDPRASAGGRALLVDTGGGGPGRGDRGERVSSRRCGGSGSVASPPSPSPHGAPDHAGGLAGLLEGVRDRRGVDPAGSRGRGMARRRWSRGDPLDGSRARRPPVDRLGPGHRAPPAARRRRTRSSPAGAARRSRSCSGSTGACSRRCSRPAPARGGGGLLRPSSP